MTRSRAGLGLVAKTGRAIVVVVTGTRDAPRLAERGELALWSKEIAGTQQPFHRVMGLPWPAALAAAAPGVREIERLAREALAALLKGLAARGLDAAAAGVVGSAGGDPGRIGSPHVRAHAAEGQLYRRALEEAARALGLPSATFPAKDAWGSIGLELGLDAEALKARVAPLGKGTIRPWRADERVAAAAGWAALALPATP